MEELIEFLHKCDIGFDIKFRNGTSDPSAQFYFSFDVPHQVKVADIGEKPERFSFANGATPNEALENAAKELNFKVLIYNRLVDGEWVEGYASFKLD